MSTEAQPVQGFSDIGMPEILLWQRVESQARNVFALYGFQEVRTPIVEKYELFVRSLGDTTDVVQKEMYVFEDRGGRKLALRPEGTAGVVRFISIDWPQIKDERLYYIGPMFRAERPQAGRKRQFHQLGAEIIGGANAALDAECLALQQQLISNWGLKNFTIEVNTRGLPSDRSLVSERLKALLQPMYNEFCEDCQKRFEKNILRIIDCKNTKCRALTKDIPDLSSFMSDEARRYFDDFLHYLDILKVKYIVNPRLVRGLDYYIHSVWEITHKALGSQDAITGGGRYSIRIANQNIEGVGYAMGLERVITALINEGIKLESLQRMPDVWLISLGRAAFDSNLELSCMLREKGLYCLMEYQYERSLKAQMREASAKKAKYVIIRGDLEISKAVFILKNMSTGVQEEFSLSDLLERLLLV